MDIYYPTLLSMGSSQGNDTVKCVAPLTRGKEQNSVKSADAGHISHAFGYLMHRPATYPSGTADIASQGFRRIRKILHPQTREM